MGRPRKNPIEGPQELVEIDGQEINANDVNLNEAQSEVDARDEKINSLSRQVAELSQLIRSKDNHRKVKKEIRHTTRIMFNEGNPVIDFGKARSISDKQMSIKLIVLKPDGSTEECEADYEQAVVHNLRHEAEVLELNKETVTTHQGAIPREIRAKVADEINRRSSQGDAYVSRSFVPEHTQIFTKARIKFLEGPWEGKEIEVDADACFNR